MLLKRDEHETERHTWTDNTEMEKHVSCKWKKKKKARVPILMSDKIVFKKRDCIMKQITVVHNDKGINLTRGYNNCTYVWIQH